MISCTGKQVTIREKFDPDSSLHYVVYLKPPVWTPNTEKNEGDIVSPSSATGYVYKVTSSGITDVTEPIWSTQKGDITSDNTVEYTAISNKFYLTSNASLVISGTPPVISASDSVPVSDLQYDPSGKISFKIGPVPPDVETFSVTVGFYTDFGYSSPDYDERTINFEVEDR